MTKAERFVIDSNVLISAALRASGPPASLLEAMRGSTVALLFSHETQAELVSRLMKSKFDRYVSRAMRQRFLAQLDAVSEFVSIVNRPMGCHRDPSKSGDDADHSQGLLSHSCAMPQSRRDESCSSNSQQGNGDISEAGHHERAAFSNSAPILVKSYVADPVQAIFNGPMIADQCHESFRTGFFRMQTCNAVDGFTRCFSGWLELPFSLYAKGLSDMRKIEKIVEFRCRPDCPLFNSSVGLFIGSHPRGKNRRVSCRRCLCAVSADCL